MTMLSYTQPKPLGVTMPEPRLMGSAPAMTRKALLGAAGSLPLSLALAANATNDRRL